MKVFNRIYINQNHEMFVGFLAITKVQKRRDGDTSNVVIFPLRLKILCRCAQRSRASLRIFLVNMLNFIPFSIFFM